MKNILASLKFSAPSKLNTLREISVPLDLLQTLSHLPKLFKLPKGDGRTIILVPGYMANEYSMWPLKTFLSRMGYNTYHWDLGKNKGDVDEDILRLGKKVLSLFNQTSPAKITLIGWSLGGVLAREVARLFQPEVREVITLGTPITGGPKYTAIGRRFAKRRKLDMDSFEQHVLERNSIGFPQPVTSIYSKSDGIVGWQASIDTYNRHAENIEVKGTHLGLGINSDVWEVILNTLHRSHLNAA